MTFRNLYFLILGRRYTHVLCDNEIWELSHIYYEPNYVEHYSDGTPTLRCEKICLKAKGFINGLEGLPVNFDFTSSGDDAFLKIVRDIITELELSFVRGHNIVLKKQ